MTEGFVGQAYYFDGLDDYIELPELELANFTVSAWVQTDEIGWQGNNRMAQ